MPFTRRRHYSTPATVKRRGRSRSRSVKQERKHSLSSNASTRRFSSRSASSVRNTANKDSGEVITSYTKYKQRPNKQVKFAKKISSALAQASLKKDVYRWVTSDFSESPAGLQQYKEVIRFDDQAKVNTLINAINGAGGSGPGASDTDLTILGKHVEIQLTNMSEGEAHVDFYTVVARKNNNRSPMEAFADGLLSRASLVPTGYNAYNCPGVTFFESPQFTSLYRVIKKQHFQMSAGGTKIVSFGTKRNRTKVKLSELVDGATTYKKTSKYVLMCHHGEVAKTASSGYNWDVCRLAWTIVQSWWWTHPNDIDVSSSTSLAVAFGTGYGEQIIGAIGQIIDATVPHVL